MESKNKNKRKLHDNDSDTDSDLESTSSWASFLVIHGTDEDKPLRKLSPFAIAKGIQGLAGEPKKVTRMRSGDLLIEVSQRSHSKNLLRSTMLVNVPIKVYPHKTLNSRKGVIRCSELKYCDDKEILDGLASQNVKEVTHIKVTRDGKKEPTGTLILTFDLTTLPREVKVGYLNVPVEMYIPNPMRCFKCQRYGHHRDNCKHNDTCARCGGVDHDDKECDKPPHCVNCSGDHTAFSKSCPKWQEEKEVQKLKCTLDLTFPEARKLIESRRSPDTQKTTYAGAVSKETQKKTTSVSVQTELTWLNDSNNPKKLPNSTTIKRTIATQSESVSNQSTKLKENNKPKLNRGSGRVPKGSEDPITQHNKFRVLDDEGEEEDMMTEVIPPTPSQQSSKKGKARGKSPGKAPT